MRSPAAAVAWELRQRHRWGLIAVVAWLAAAAIVRVLIVIRGQSVTLDDESFALVVMVPMAATFFYFLALFSFGLDGDLGARRSMYPARMLTLPVTTGALAGWPMLWGTAAMAALWFAIRLVGVWPARFDMPVVWPALLAASLLAWTQALTWMAYPLPGLRVAVTVLWLVVIDTIVMVAINLKASEPVMLALLAPHVPLAFVVARFAVARARCGEVPDSRQIFARAGEIFLPRRRGQFPSALRAQEWFEWRQHGRSLPWLVGILLPFELTLLFLFSQTPEIVFETLLFVLLTPPFVATFVAATVSKSGGATGNSYGVAPFIATRPLTNASLIAAKLRTTIRSTLAAWLLIVIAVPLALRLSGSAAVVMERMHRLVEIFGMARAVAVILLAFIALLATTWKQLVQGLYIGMSGREWVVKASTFSALAFLAVAGPVAHWIITTRAAFIAFWNALPLIAAVVVLFRIAVAALIVVRLRDRQLVSDRALVIGALSWDVAVIALYGLLVWIFPALLIRAYFLALLAILAIPLTRLSAAPLALAWSRHR